MRTRTTCPPPCLLLHILFRLLLSFTFSSPLFSIQLESRNFFCLSTPLSLFFSGLFSPIAFYHVRRTETNGQSPLTGISIFASFPLITMKKKLERICFRMTTVFLSRNAKVSIPILVIIIFWWSKRLYLIQKFEFLFLRFFPKHRFSLSRLNAFSTRLKKHFWNEIRTKLIFVKINWIRQMILLFYKAKSHSGVSWNSLSERFSKQINKNSYWSYIKKSCTRKRNKNCLSHQAVRHHSAGTFQRIIFSKDKINKHRDRRKSRAQRIKIAK